MYGIILVLLSLAVIPFLVNEAYANHYLDNGLDDVFTWREHDVSSGSIGVDCAFNGIMESPDDDTQISLFCRRGGVGNVHGAMYVMKVFDVADFTNGTTTVFSWKFDNQCVGSVCPRIAMSVMDGAYDYQSLSVPGGFPNNVNWGADLTNDDCASTTYFQRWWDDNYDSICMFEEDITPTDANDLLGVGHLEITGKNPTFVRELDFTETKGVTTFAISITNSLWAESSQSQFTVFLVILEQTSGTVNHFLQPIWLDVTNTDFGDLRWNFPNTADDADDWELFGGEGTIQQTGTSSDHGFFFSYDPSIPNSPTNLFATVSGDNINLFWTAPIFVGFDPLIGYKIEREQPIGGGFNTITSNTGNTLLTFTDNTIIPGLIYNYRVSALNSFGASLPSNESKDGTPTDVETTEPDIDCTGELVNFEVYPSKIGSTDVTLCWNGEILTTLNVTGYQINFTTPWGIPLNIQRNDTQSSATTRLILDLASGTQYSFRVQAWDNFTAANQTNIINITTTGSSFDIGDLIFDGALNPTVFDWFWQEEHPNDNDVSLLIHYPNGFNATCVFDMKFARTNQTFSNISTIPSDVYTSRQMANFTFTDFNNEIVTANCIDENTNSTGRYLLYQTDFPLKQQIASFRDGTYGTMGLFGVFDFFTIGAIMFSMVGFNRIHPGVAAVFSIMILGVATYLGFIQDWSVILGGVVIAVMFLAMLVHNRNDVS